MYVFIYANGEFTDSCLPFFKNRHGFGWRPVKEKNKCEFKTRGVSFWDLVSHYEHQFSVFGSFEKYFWFYTRLHYYN